MGSEQEARVWVWHGEPTTARLSPAPARARRRAGLWAGDPKFASKDHPVFSGAPRRLHGTALQKMSVSCNEEIIRRLIGHRLARGS